MACKRNKIFLKIKLHSSPKYSVVGHTKPAHYWEYRCAKDKFSRVVLGPKGKKNPIKDECRCSFNRCVIENNNIIRPFTFRSELPIKKPRKKNLTKHRSADNDHSA